MAGRTFIQKELKRLETNYGKDRFKVTQAMFDLWADMLKDLEEEGIRVSVDEYIKTNEFPPTVASIVKIYEAKDRLRKEQGNYLRAKCNYISRWYEKPMTQEEIDTIKGMVTKLPVDRRKGFLDYMALEAVRYYYKCVTSGEKEITIAKFLEGFTWTQNDK